MPNKSTLLKSTAVLSNSAVILAAIGKVTTDSLESLGHADQAIEFAGKYKIDLCEFEDLKRSIDEIERKLIDEDGAYVQRALDKLDQLRVVVALQAKMLAEMSRELYENLFGTIDLTDVDQPHLPGAIVAGAGGADVHDRKSVHIPAAE